MNLTDKQIKHLVDRFLAWRLPEHFRPDCGISFKPVYNEHSQFGPSRHQPTGTNLFDAQQATAMVKHMLEGLPDPEPSYPTPTAAPEDFPTKLPELPTLYDDSMDLPRKPEETVEQVIARLVKERDEARQMIVWGFYEEEVPRFIQGPKGQHELCEPVTADQATNWCMHLKAVRSQLDQKKKVLQRLGVAMGELVLEATKP